MIRTLLIMYALALVSACGSVEVSEGSCVAYCVEQQAYVCNADGVFVTAQLCGDDTTCTNGACLPNEDEASDVLEGDAQEPMADTPGPSEDSAGSDSAEADTACTPACEGKSCGDDGCGGSCGECDEATECTEGSCVPTEVVCTPSCGDAVCGDDGCGGSCGSCEDGVACWEGGCLPMTGACTMIEFTEANDYMFTDAFVVAWEEGCFSPEATVDDIVTCTTNLMVEGGHTPGCSSCLAGFLVCQAVECNAACSGAEPDACGACIDEVCVPPTITCAYVGDECTPSCEGKACGADGCGGQCGVCGDAMSCDDGACVAEKSCSASDDQIAPLPESQLMELGPLCVTAPNPSNCVIDAMSELGMSGSCAHCHADYFGCAYNKCPGACLNGIDDTCVACLQAANCIPNFESCAEAPPLGCVPSCAQGSCGDDGCGGTCGPCQSGQACVNGQCENCYDSPSSLVPVAEAFLTGSEPLGSCCGTDLSLLISDAGLEGGGGSHACGLEFEWRSEIPPPGSFALQLAEIGDVNKVKVWNAGEEDGGFGAKEVKITVGFEGEDHTVVYNGTLDKADQCPVEGQIITFPPVTGNQVKVTIKNNWEEGLESVGLGEIRVWSFKPPNLCDL